jgi:hypothetical protein
VSPHWLPAAVATVIARQLAQQYHGDRASADWRHLGRLAGLTNQKPQRRLPSGWPPWVKVRHAMAGFASQGRILIDAACSQLALNPESSSVQRRPDPRTGERVAGLPVHDPVAPTVTKDQAVDIYRTWLHRLQVHQRFPQPDWSVVDLWVAKQLFSQNWSAADVEAILRGDGVPPVVES